jgi:hypothetical protein
MPHDAVTLREDVLLRRNPGDNDRVVRTQYIPRAETDTTISEDTWKDFDLWAARQVMDTLEKHYPGHTWRVVHDSFQCVCLISIPILMGINKYMAVNLKTHALDDHRVINAGGEILERYGLARGAFELAPFLDAREKHSALVVPSRAVPG